MSIRFWEGDILARVALHRHHQGEVHPDCYVAAITYLMSFVSSKPGVVSDSGCSSKVFRALETCGLFKNGIQYPFRFEVFFSRNSSTRTSYRRSNTFFAGSTCSRSSSTWLFTCDVVRASHGPSSVLNFARFLFLKLISSTVRSFCSLLFLFCSHPSSHRRRRLTFQY